jgi:hypothetical protein
MWVVNIVPREGVPKGGTPLSCGVYGVYEGKAPLLGSWHDQSQSRTRHFPQHLLDS